MTAALILTDNETVDTDASLYARIPYPDRDSGGHIAP
jgi:hypothetical protein